MENSRSFGAAVFLSQHWGCCLLTILVSLYLFDGLSYANKFFQ